MNKHVISVLEGLYIKDGLLPPISHKIDIGYKIVTAYSKQPKNIAGSKLINKIFVYGTLKKGFHNHYLMKGYKNYTQKVIVRDMIIFKDGLPYMNYNPGDYVIGELYEYEEDTITDKIRLIDRLEGFDYMYHLSNFYERILIELENKELAWAYISPKNTLGEKVNIY